MKEAYKKELNDALLVLTRVSLMHRAGLVSVIDASAFAVKTLMNEVFKKTPSELSTIIAKFVPVIILKISKDFNEDLVELVLKAYDEAEEGTDLDTIFNNIELKVINISDVKSIEDLKDLYDIDEVASIDTDDLNYGR